MCVQLGRPGHVQVARAPHPLPYCVGRGPQVTANIGSYKPADLARIVWGYGAAGADSPKLIAAASKVRDEGAVNRRTQNGGANSEEVAKARANLHSERRSCKPMSASRALVSSCRAARADAHAVFALNRVCVRCGRALRRWRARRASCRAARRCRRCGAWRASARPTSPRSTRWLAPPSEPLPLRSLLCDLFDTSQHSSQPSYRVYPTSRSLQGCTRGTEKASCVSRSSLCAPRARRPARSRAPLPPPRPPAAPACMLSLGSLCVACDVQGQAGERRGRGGPGVGARLHRLQGRRRHGQGEGFMGLMGPACAAAAASGMTRICRQRTPPGACAGPGVGRRGAGGGVMGLKRPVGVIAVCARSRACAGAGCGAQVARGRADAGARRGRRLGPGRAGRRQGARLSQVSRWPWWPRGKGRGRQGVLGGDKVRESASAARRGAVTSEAHRKGRDGLCRPGGAPARARGRAHTARKPGSFFRFRQRTVSVVRRRAARPAAGRRVCAVCRGDGCGGGVARRSGPVPAGLAVRGGGRQPRRGAA